MNSSTELTGRLDWLRRFAAANLTLPQAVVLTSLVEAAQSSGMLDQGEYTLALSRYDIAQLTGLTPSQVQRALTALTSAGLLVRAQLLKRDGEVARTMLTPRALELMDMRGDSLQTSALPLEVCALLLGEHASIVHSVSRAWAACEALPTDVARDFRGRSCDLEALRRIFFDRLAKREDAVLEAKEMARAREDEDINGEYPLSLPDGTSVVLNQHAFRGDGGSKSLLTLADMRFIRDTVDHLAKRAPASVTRVALPKLIAEIAFSRVAGFVMTHDAMHAIRVLSNCIAKPGWSKPRRMDGTWYEAARRAICAQGVRMCAA